MILPRLYAILDVDVAARYGHEPGALFDAWVSTGVTCIQLRAKTWGSGAVLALADELARRAAASGVIFLVNDRADIARAAGAAGVHLGQEDLGPALARRIVGPRAVVGWSTHTDDQVRAALETPIDYLAIGPVFETASKHRPDPVVGLAGVERAAALARVRGIPVVAIGGITSDRAPAVLRAGASSVAVIADLLIADPAARAATYLSALAP